MLVRFAIGYMFLEIVNLIVTQNFVRGVIYSIFVANCGSENEAFRISSSRTFTERIRKNYFQSYITEYKREYDLYTKLSRSYIGYWLVSLIFLMVVGTALIILDVISVNTFFVICALKGLIEGVFAMIFYVIHYDSNKKTKFDRGM